MEASLEEILKSWMLTPLELDQQAAIRQALFGVNTPFQLVSYHSYRLTPAARRRPWLIQMMYELEAKLWGVGRYVESPYSLESFTEEVHYVPIRGH